MKGSSISGTYIILYTASVLLNKHYITQQFMFSIFMLYKYLLQFWITCSNRLDRMLIDLCLESSIKRVGKKKYVSKTSRYTSCRSMILLNISFIIVISFTLAHHPFSHLNSSCLFLSSFAPLYSFLIKKCHHPTKQRITLQVGTKEHHWWFPVVQHPYILKIINNIFHHQCFKYPMLIMMFVLVGPYYEHIRLKALM